MSIYHNPISTLFSPIDITQQYSMAVDPDSIGKLLEILRVLSNEFGGHPILYGGSLRDLYLDETPKDYDIAIEWSPDLRYRFEREVSGCSLNGDGKHSKIVKIDGQIFKIDLSFRSLEKEIYFADDRVRMADAPINAIAMDDTGQIFAHPDFEDHATMGTYAIRKDLGSEREQVSLDRLQRFIDKGRHFQLP